MSAANDPCATVFAAAKHRGLNPVGDVWRHRFVCPVAPDHGRSATCLEGADGRAVLDCDGGCDSDSIETAMGLSWRDLGPPDRMPVAERAKAAAVTPGRIAAEDDVAELRALLGAHPVDVNAAKLDPLVPLPGAPFLLPQTVALLVVRPATFAGFA